MHSIRSKIMALTIAAILVTSLSLCAIAVTAQWSEEKRSAEERMRLICENSCYSINEYLNSIEQSVDMVSRFTTEQLEDAPLVSGGAAGLSGMGVSASHRERSAERQLALDRYLEDFLSRVEIVFRTVARHTSGVVTYYLRVNPEVSENVSGFFYTDTEGKGFAQMALTVIEDYDPEDVSHVGWYYIPMRQGMATWLDPYTNENIDMRMISYVTPMFKVGSFLGVVGMDVSYETLISRIRNIRIYDTGFVYVMDSAGRLIYHPTLEYGTSLAEYDPEMAWAVDIICSQTRSDALIRYQAEGETKYLCFDTLRNGLKLVVCAPAAEINAGWRHITSLVAWAAGIFLVLFTAAAVLLVNHIIRPLHSLTDASRSIAEGNYNVKLDYQGEDEVGVLTAAFQQLVDHLRIYISDLNSKAYRDAMTGVKNSGAYEAMVRQLDEEVKAIEKIGGVPQLAMVMLDCNDLKLINDRYGHEKGDIYLKTACSLICEIYPHSPVFRVGGDEFMVVLQGMPFREREALAERFRQRAAEINAANENPWDRIQIAVGMAAFEPGRDHCAEDLARRADKTMYTDKRRMKSAQGRSGEVR